MFLNIRRKIHLYKENKKNNKWMKKIHKEELSKFKQQYISGKDFFCFTENEITAFDLFITKLKKLVNNNNIIHKFVKHQYKGSKYIYYLVYLNDKALVELQVQKYEEQVEE